MFVSYLDKYKDDQEKDEKRFMKTGMHDQESPRGHQSQAQCVLMPQIEANVCGQKCNLC